MSIVRLVLWLLLHEAEHTVQIGDFIQISSSDLSFQQIKDHKADFHANPTQAVYMASIMPISGLQDFGDAEVSASLSFRRHILIAAGQCHR